MALQSRQRRRFLLPICYQLFQLSNKWTTGKWTTGLTVRDQPKSPLECCHIRLDSSLAPVLIQPGHADQLQCSFKVTENPSSDFSIRLRTKYCARRENECKC